MKRGWENLIRYREDGDYSIDNSIAERAVRPYTVFRNGTMFHGSERRVENTTFFYSLIETGKARGLNVKNYLVSMIREMLHGNTDYKVSFKASTFRRLRIKIALKSKFSNCYPADNKRGRSN